MSDQSTSYPAAERLDLVETLHGHRVADPYRWLEDAADPRTKAWSAAQDELASAHLDGLPGREALAGHLRTLLSSGSVSVPLWRAGRRFSVRREPGQEHAVVLVREPDGTERVLLDPIAIDPTGLTTIDGWAPDLEGRRLAYQLSAGGDEQSVLHVLDVATGEDVEPPIDRCRYSAVAWLPGGEEFLFVRMVDAAEVPEGQQAFHRRIWRHRIGTPTTDDVLVEAPGLYDGHNYYGVRVSRDGAWMVVTANVGTARRDSLWVGPVGGDLERVLAQDDDVQCSAWVDRDGRLYLLTTDGAPRWRLAVTDPSTPGRGNWRPLVDEDPGSVLDAVVLLDGDAPRLAVLRSRHAVSELALHHPDGTPAEAVALPGTGSVPGLTVADRDTPAEHGRLWIGWTDLVTPPQVHRYEAGALVLEATAPGAVEVPDVRTEQREFTSADGTTVRMFVVTPATGDGPRPTLVTGYGGFGISREPAYTASALAWVAAGGGYALVSLRGGGEEGEDWHRAGNRGHKQHTFDDLHAAAQALVDVGDTTPRQLSIMGGSNGGLLVGAALVQRPDLYAAVVCSAPLLDMVRYEEFSLGRTWNEEYGTADDPTELGWLLSYSPYHHVTDGVDYPATLFTVFESDTRVDPLHARKMCAALQHATAGGAPILLRRETDVGHGARSVSRTVGLAADQLAFLAAHTGLELATRRMAP
ncbi:S9 family peptidase [Pseudonocardia sp. KRD-184]|uniref:S9 family peptidase n=1 Tax=Pseudonocardia oceani TaxID=2792013 RepID=A0ABS6UDJ2_9PSEU|nr:prolyl oligopeptidase family serine peptidase [Pseudonocardia oceani]MBW0093716.1 S9 family peptidase [Pseudonocardia oceani]MBW0100394.1 S9 family peptidase [Pseudonocardia oceani]MBW0113089.1 S9 family peptidase [Pseudonocardia oceani]MBW0125923.1 S9 family peptidase [Pseudonocardia oceani]MBW0130312.1 S9 family peptidase [Pseudonocardia oceani]